MIVKVGVGRMILAYEDYVYEVHMYNPKALKMKYLHILDLYQKNGCQYPSTPLHR